jgi:hypothetical protein
MATSTKKRKRSASTKPRRRRCQGECHRLLDPCELTRVGSDLLCQDCLTAEAIRLAPPDDPDPNDTGSLVGVPSAEPYHAPRRIDTPEDAGRVLQEVMGDGSGEALPEFDPDQERTAPGLRMVGMPAPSTQPEPELDIESGDEDLLLEREWQHLPSLQIEGWPLRYGRVSASALSSFARCPEAFRRKHVLGEKEPVRGAPHTGSAVHKALEVAIRFQMEQGEQLRVKRVEEVYQDAFSTRLARELDRGAPDWGKDGRGDKRYDLTEDAWRRRGETALHAYLDQALPQLRPIATEEMFAVSVPGVPVPLCGYIDVRQPGEMVDWKFGSKRSFKIAPDWRLAALCYLQAFDARIAYHSVNWGGELVLPGPEVDLRVERTAENYAVSIKIVQMLVDGILAFTRQFGATEPWPANIGHPFACSGCTFQPTCPGWHLDMSTEVLL